MTELLTGFLEYDFEILKRLDVNEIVNVLLTNKIASTYLNSEQFWQKYVYFNYPDLIQFKPPTETFKSFFQIIREYPIEEESIYKALKNKNVNALLYLSKLININDSEDINFDRIFKSMSGYNDSPDIFIEFYKILNADAQVNFYEHLLRNVGMFLDERADWIGKNFCYKLLMRLTRLGYFIHEDHTDDLLDVDIQEFSKSKYFKWIKLLFDKGFNFDRQTLNICFVFLDWDFIEKIMLKFGIRPTNNLYAYLPEINVDIIREIIERFGIIPEVDDYTYDTLRDNEDTESLAYLATL